MNKYLLLILLLTSLFSQSIKDLTERPVLNAVKISEKITLDGIFDEKVWSNVEVASNFTGAGIFEGKPSDYVTEAKVAYDENNLYLAITAYVDREDLRLSVTRRDNVDGRDDRVFIQIDAFDDESLIYGIGVSASNAQIDGRAGFGWDQSLDLIYDTEVKVFEDRYQAEFSIPFSSLRYSISEKQDWRITFGRGYTLDDEITRYVWWSPKVDGIECQTCQLGYLKNIYPPKQKRGKPSFIPSVVAGNTDNFSSNESNKFDEASMFIKYPISSVDLFEVAINPDFSQIESDDVRNDFNTVNALYFPERRPFFSEGSELFKLQSDRGFINLFYSRTINDPSLIAKYTGKIGKTSYGVISARDESSLLLLPFEETSTVVKAGEATNNIFRVKQMLKNGGSIGAMVSSRDFDYGGDMLTSGIDFHYHPGYNIHLTVHGAMSVHNESDDREYNPENVDGTFDSGNHTKAFDGEKINGSALGLAIIQWTKTDSRGFVARFRSPGFRTSNGFEQNNNTKWIKINRGKSIFHDNHPRLLKSDYNIELIHKENYGGLVKRHQIEIEGDYEFNNGYKFYWDVETNNENFKGVEFKGDNEIRFGFSANLNAQMNMSSGITHGGRIIRYLDIPEIGTENSFYIRYGYDITNQTGLNFSFSYEDVSDYYYGYIFKSSVNHAFTSRLSLRTKLQYSGFSKNWFIEPMVTYQPSAYSALYVGVNDLLETEDGIFSNLRETERQLFIKFQYLF